MSCGRWARTRRCPRRCGTGWRPPSPSRRGPRVDGQRRNPNFAASFTPSRLASSWRGGCWVAHPPGWMGRLRGGIAGMEMGGGSAVPSCPMAARGCAQHPGGSSSTQVGSPSTQGLSSAPRWSLSSWDVPSAQVDPPAPRDCPQHPGGSLSTHLGPHIPGSVPRHPGGSPSTWTALSSQVCPQNPAESLSTQVCLLPPGFVPWHPRSVPEHPGGSLSPSTHMSSDLPPLAGCFAGRTRPWGPATPPPS